MSQTRLEDFPGALVEDRFQAVLAETFPGGRFADFSIALPEQATQLTLSAGFVSEIGKFVTNVDEVSELIELLSPTKFFPVEGRKDASGLLDEISRGDHGFRRSLHLSFEPDRGPEGRASSFIGYAYDVGQTPFPNPEIVFSVMLVRQSIPEPTTLALFAIGIAFLFALKKQMSTK